jgi:hypothetical protein
MDPSECRRNTNLVITPKLPPPRSPKNKTGSFSALAQITRLSTADDLGSLEIVDHRAKPAAQSAQSFTQCEPGDTCMRRYPCQRDQTDTSSPRIEIARHGTAAHLQHMATASTATAHIDGRSYTVSSSQVDRSCSIVKAKSGPVTAPCPYACQPPVERLNRLQN